MGKIKRRIRIAIDCDDVLIRCNDYALQLLGKKYGKTFSMKGITQWGTMDNILDERISYFQEPAFVATQPLYCGAQDFIAQLSRVGDVILVTSVPPQCSTARQRYLETHFPGVSYIITQDKSMIHTDVMLDDNPTWLKKADVNIPCLYSRPWNRCEETNFPSVSSYSEFLSFIREVGVG